MSFQISRLFRGRTNCLVPLQISRDLASSSTEGLSWENFLATVLNDFCEFLNARKYKE